MVRPRRKVAACLRKGELSSASADKVRDGQPWRGRFSDDNAALFSFRPTATTVEVINLNSQREIALYVLGPLNECFAKAV
jgi:hypothetical protein